MYQEDFHLLHYRHPPPPPNCRRNTWKTDEVYDLLQSAKLTCVDDLWTQTLHSISQSPRATSVRHHSLTSFGTCILLRGFPEFKGHPRRLTLRIGGNRRLRTYEPISCIVIFVYRLTRKHKLDRGCLVLTPCQVWSKSLQWLQRRRKWLCQSEARTAIFVNRSDPKSSRIHSTVS